MSSSAPRMDPSSGSQCSRQVKCEEHSTGERQESKHREQLAPQPSKLCGKTFLSPEKLPVVNTHDKAPWAHDEVE